MHQKKGNKSECKKNKLIEYKSKQGEQKQITTEIIQGSRGNEKVTLT